MMKTLKNWMVVLLLLGVGCYTFNQFFMLMLFKTNQDFIAQNLCENRNKPAMKCCGKCLLKKKLAQTEDNTGNGKQLPTKIDKSGFECCALTSVFLSELFFDFTPFIKHPKKQSMFSNAIANNLFHPPPLVS